MGKKHPDEIRTAVRHKYAEVAKGDFSGCACSPSSTCCGDPAVSLSSLTGYSQDELIGAPEGSNMGLGCGNPLAFASLKPGETVLDLGSGGGFDCFLAARQVGEGGKVIGVDMTPEMVCKAREDALGANYSNVDFRLGEIEHLPVADAAIDVVISNCVVNLSPKKPEVFQEVYRILKPGGRLAISDVVATAQLPPELKNDLDLLSACVSGAATVVEIEEMLQEVGFKHILIQPRDESRDFIRQWVPGKDVRHYIVAAIIQAVKPQE